MALRFAPYVAGNYLPPGFGPPGAPTTPVATAGNASASISSSATTNGGSPITSFTVTSSPGGFTGSGASFPIGVSGLANGTAYTFTVTATSALGTGPASLPSNSVTPATGATFPQAPTIGTATAGNTNASVTFTANGTGGSPITSFKATASPGGSNAAGTSPITVPGLANGTAYTFTVTATNAIGTSPPSAASNSVTPLSTAAPGQVTNLQILFQGMAAAGGGFSGGAPVPTSANTQAIGWTQGVAGSFPITQNKIYRATNGGAFTLLTTIAAATSYTDAAATACVGSTALPHNAQGQAWAANGYLYKVSAVDSQGTEGPQSTTQIFVYYKNGTKWGMGGDVNNACVSNYTDTTGIAGNPFGSTHVLLNTTGSFGDWLPYAGNNGTQWNIWCGLGSPAQVFAFLNISLKPSIAGQTWNAWGEYRNDTNHDPTGSTPGVTAIGNAAALYGPQAQSGVWNTYKLPLLKVMVTATSDYPPGGVVGGMFYKLGLADQSGLGSNHYWVDNVYFSPT